MNLAVVIPTYQRIAKLDRCIRSILDGTLKTVSVYVYCDNNDVATFEHVMRTYAGQPVSVMLNTRHLYVIGAWNNFTRMFYPADSWDAMAWIVDDVELYPTCLEKATQALQRYWPDLDGVIGMSQECPGHPEYSYKVYGQVILGKPFVGRYAGAKYEVCCPDYVHFYQDEEMYMFADSLDRFRFCPDAKLKHYHPGFIRNEMDDTHGIVRGELYKQDRNIYAQRRARNLVWGKSWERVNA